MFGAILTPDQFMKNQAALLENGFQRCEVCSPGDQPYKCPHCGGNCMVLVSYALKKKEEFHWRDYNLCIDCLHAVEDFPEMTLPDQE